MNRKADRKLLRTKAEKLARDIIDLLLEKEIMDDTFIYVNGKRYGTYDGEHGYNYGTNSWDNVYVEDDKIAKDYCEYAGDILSISSEGPLYDLINYGWEFGESKTVKALDELFHKYGFYREDCTSWFYTAVKE